MNPTGSAIMLYTVVAAAILVYLPFTVVGYARMQVGYDSSAPRAMFDKLPSYAQRANWAHQNSFETFIIFSAAALMAYVTGQSSAVAIGAAIAFVVARAFYSLCYIFNIPWARSLMFAIGNISSFTLFILSLISVSSKAN